MDRIGGFRHVLVPPSTGCGASRRGGYVDQELYLEWVAALKANPEMPLDELRHMFEQWGRITGEPGGVDYIEIYRLCRMGVDLAMSIHRTDYVAAAMRAQQRPRLF